MSPTSLSIYLDHHATTPLDPRVLEEMLPYLTTHYGNAGSISHVYGHDAARAVDHAREKIAAAIGAEPREIVFTSGATESNNLAIRGFCENVQRRQAVKQKEFGRLISVATEHKSVLDPIQRLGRRGWNVALLPVQGVGHPEVGRVRLDLVEQTLCQNGLGQTATLASVMLANNEIGVIQQAAEIGALCRRIGAVFHCDATQAVGKIPVDVERLGVDLMSFSAHKIYGPKGVGALYVRRRGGRVRLVSQIDGGQQEGQLRSGTLNVPGIVGFAKALELCAEELPSETDRLRRLRNDLYHRLAHHLSDLVLHGPPLESGPLESGPADQPELRLPGNLNCGFPQVDGEALLASLTKIAVSSGAACATGNSQPSYVLRAIGVDDGLSRASLRFGLGRFNTAEHVEIAVEEVTRAVRSLQQTSI